MSRNWSNDSYPTNKPRKPSFRGGKHICRIVKVDDTNDNYTEIYLDIYDDNDVANKFFSQRANNDLSQWWSWGKKKIFLYDLDALKTGEKKMSGIYNCLVGAIEASNPGYDFEQTGYNEQTWVGKSLGVVWKDQIKKKINGEEKTDYYPSYFTAIDDLATADIPEPKMVEDKILNAKKEPPIVDYPDNSVMPKVPDFIDDDDIPF